MRIGYCRCWVCCNVGAGELVSINDEGIRIEKYTEDTQVAIAAMEYVYFARPDSNIAGINVHSARKKNRTYTC